MKKQVTIASMAFIAACASLLSCQKTTDLKTGKTAAREVQPGNPGTPPQLFVDYIISNDGYCLTCFENVHAILNRNTLHPTFNGNEDVIGVFGSNTGMKGYAEWNGIKAITYNDIQNNNTSMLKIFAHPNAALLGNYPLVNASGGAITVDEIEVNPADNNIYALGTNFLSKCIYRIDIQNSQAKATLIGNVFTNTLANGYISGSIAFVQDQNTLLWHLAFTHESTHYSQGIITWNFLISNGTLTSDAAHPAETHTGISSMFTGKVNTVSLYGLIYFARDYDTLYKLTPGGGVATAQPGGVINAANDFGPRPVIIQ